MPLPLPYTQTQPTVTPAPIDPVTPKPIVEGDKIIKKENYEEHNFSIAIDPLGKGVAETSLLFGYLDYIKIISDFPCRIVVCDATDEEDIIYNSHVRTREKALIRARTQDQNGRFHNVPDKIFLNNSLKIVVHGSRESNVHVKIVITR